MLEAWILDRYLKTTGLPYSVAKLPPLRPRGRPGIQITFNVDCVEYLYSHNREWWWFEASGDGHLWPAVTTEIRSSDWPLFLGLEELGWKMAEWWQNLSPFLVGPPGEEQIATGDEDVLRQWDWFRRAANLVALTASQDLRFNSRAVAPLAKWILAERAWETRR